MQTDVVLEVNGEPVTAREYEARIEALPSWGRARLGSVEARQAHLYALADFEVLADEAVRRGYAEDPRVRRSLKEALASQERERRQLAGEELPSAEEAEVTVNREVVREVEAATGTDGK